jgi:predicted 2-oxoglutarate/Fe(II)-dependent dioxygenase YbiX
MIFQVDNAISLKNCRLLMEMYDSNVDRTEIRDITDHPVVYWKHIKEIPCAKVLITKLINKCVEQTLRKLEIRAPVYPETAVLATMGPGGYHPRHADNCAQDENGDWAPNHTPHRDVSAICYLNEDFEGGELIFEQYSLTIKPRRGLIVLFPSDQAHIHEVLPVKSGRRYTVALWFTKQKARCIPAFAEFKHRSFFLGFPKKLVRLIRQGSH